MSSKSSVECKQTNLPYDKPENTIDRPIILYTIFEDIIFALEYKLSMKKAEFIPIQFFGLGGICTLGSTDD